MRWSRVWSVVWLMMAACSCRPIVSQEYSPGSILFAPGDGQHAVSLVGAGNEWIDFVVRVEVSEKSDLRLRFVGLNRLGPDARIYRVDSTGRFLIPLRYDPGTATGFDIPDNGSVWVDIHVPVGTSAGDYAGSCQLVQKSRLLAEIPLHLRVYGFAISDQPKLSIAGEATSAGLRRLYHGHLPDSVNPLIALGQQDRVQFWFSDLQPKANLPATAQVWQCPADDKAADAELRAMAYRAYLDRHQLIFCPGAVTSDRSLATWFCADDEDGQTGPLESVLIKRLRDAEEEFEYIALAERAARVGLIHQLAGLLVRPMEVRADSADRAMTGTMDAAAFAQGKEFLARVIESKTVSAREQERWKLQLVRWIASQSVPIMLARGTAWWWDKAKPGQIDLRLGVDIYNPSDIPATGNTLAWSNLPAGWQANRTAVDVRSLPAHQIIHASLPGLFDATQLRITTDVPSRISFTSGYDASRRDLTVNVPVASCDRRIQSPVIDGSLSDWSTDDTIFNGRLGGNSSEASSSNSPMMILSSFSNSQLFLAFRTQEIPNADCEMTIQPLFAGNSLGKIFHLVCKPHGSSRGNSPEALAYAATVASGIWRGELAIPWKMLSPENGEPPSALRFNLLEKSGASEVGSWAGPVSPDDSENAMTGILVLRDSPGKLVRSAHSIGH